MSNVIGNFLVEPGDGVMLPFQYRSSDTVQYDGYMAYAGLISWAFFDKKPRVSLVMAQALAGVDCDRRFKSAAELVDIAGSVPDDTEDYDAVADRIQYIHEFNPVKVSEQTAEPFLEPAEQLGVQPWYIINKLARVQLGRLGAPHAFDRRNVDDSYDFDAICKDLMSAYWFSYMDETSPPNVFGASGHRDGLAVVRAHWQENPLPPISFSAFDMMMSGGMAAEAWRQAGVPMPDFSLF